MTPKRSSGFAITIVALWLLGCAAIAGRAQTMDLKIGDGKDWAFINGAWHEDETGRIDCPDARDTHFLAFYLPHAFSDVTAEFDLMTSYRETGSGDAGIILRASDANHYYWIRFPWCGQQLRAKHFWAAISAVDESGYIRNLAFAMIPGVPSETDRWYNVRVECAGSQIRVWVDGRRGPAVTDSRFARGRVGFAGYGGFALRNVRVSGNPQPAEPWDANVQPPRNWFHPAPNLAGGQNMPSICRTPKGDLLLAIPSEKATFLVRSTDNGRTWGEAQELPASLHGGVVHCTKNGRLMIQVYNTDPRGILTAESTDDGRTWFEPAPAELAGTWPADPPKLSPYGPLLELADGTLVRLLLGGMTGNQGKNVVQWGSIHCQAFAIRSTDGGKTWSAPANLDRPSWTGQAAGTIDGSLDLTEPVAAVLDTGRILCYIRPIYSPTMWETFSDDGGQTWTSARRGAFPGYAPCMVRTTSGVLLVAHRFPGHSINVSRDNGVTWDEGTTVDFPVWAMGCMFEVEPEVVLFVYMDANRQYLRAQRIRVTAQGLEPIRPGQESKAQPDTLRNKMWVWGTRESRGGDDRGLAAWAEASPAARAKMLGLRNVIIAGGKVLEPDEAAALARECAPLGGRIAYEVCPGEMTGKAADYVTDAASARAAADAAPALEALLLDDLTSQQVASKGMAVGELANLCDSLRAGARPLSVWGVVYTMNLEHPGLAEYLKHLDVINLWTWRAQEVLDLDANFARCEALAPGKPIVLGLYMYDYGEGKPMPLDLMERQCETALKWLREGRIVGIVFLSITDEPAALEWTRRWIERVED
jgi:hypothetical protein